MARSSPRRSRTGQRRGPPLAEVAAVARASFGDRLHAAGLAAEMQIVRGGRPVPLLSSSLNEAFPRARPRITVWLHGLGVTETVWSFPGRPRTSYGSLLEHDAGFTPVFLRYNTGRSVKDSGAAADALLEQLVACWPVPLTEIALVGYSMGGLVVRAALDRAEARSASWVRLVRHTVHLGVPHLGAPLERLGRVTASFLRAFPNPWTKLVGAAADLRSAGVKDLARGDLAPDGAWIPLPSQGMHHAVLGTLHADPQHVLSWLLGDGIVPVASARAQRYRAPPVFPPERTTIVGGIGHLALPRSARVYPAILAAVTGRPARQPSPSATDGRARPHDEPGLDGSSDPRGTLSALTRPSTPELLPRLGVVEATLVVMGGIVGSGIFINPSVVARHVHSAPLILGAWLAGGAVALVGAFVYAELAERMPKVGGQYAYLREAFHPVVGFLYGWALLLVINAGGTAAVAVTFGRYAIELTGVPLEEKTVAVLTLLALAAVNCLGVKSGSLVQGTLMVLKIGVLGALIVFGLLLHRPPAAAPAAPPDGLLAFGGAMVPILFAYGGWQTANFIAAEVRDPRRNLPLALVAGVVGVIVLYLGANWVYLRGLGPAGLAATGTPASTLMRGLLGAPGATFIALGIAVSTLGFLSQSLLTMPRVYFAMAADGVFFPSVARVSERTHAPVVAIVLQAALGIGVALTGRYEQILGYVVSADWVFFGLTAASLFVLRKRAIGGDGVRFQVPGHPYTTGAFILVSSLVVLSTAWHYPLNTLVGLGLVLAGLPAYWAWTRRTLRSEERISLR